jgi:hypothetical protein
VKQVGDFFQDLKAELHSVSDSWLLWLLALLGSSLLPGHC